MVKTLINGARILLCAVLTIQLAGCGTLMYPERKGQKTGKIDAGVAVLDGIGLLFFIIPGLIAFAVDFNNGTIYLPGTSRSSLDVKKIKQISFDAKHSNMASIERIIKEETGYDIKMDQEDMKTSKLKSVDDMMAQFAKVLPGEQNDDIALLNRR